MPSPAGTRSSRQTTSSRRLLPVDAREEPSPFKVHTWAQIGNPPPGRQRQEVSLAKRAVLKRIGAPFDLRCTKGGQELHAEVKGTQGKGQLVKLTRNEVPHNQEPCAWETKCDAQALFVVSAVKVTGLTPSGGEMGYVWPWKITGTILCDGDLAPTEFDYTVPELTAAAC